MRRLDIHMRDSEALDTVIRAVKAAEPIDYYVVPLEQQDRKLISVFLRDGTGQAQKDTDQFADRKSTRLNSSHVRTSRMPSSA